MALLGLGPCRYAIPVSRGGKIACVSKDPEDLGYRRRLL